MLPPPSQTSQGNEADEAEGPVREDEAGVQRERREEEGGGEENEGEEPEDGASPAQWSGPGDATQQWIEENRPGVTPEGEYMFGA